MSAADDIIAQTLGTPQPVTPDQIIQQSLREEPDQDPQRVATNLERILNILSIPNNAVAGGAQALIEGTDPLKGALEGIEQHTTFGKVLKGQGLSGPVAATLGLGMDIFLDPTTYLGVGGLTKVGKAARVATLGRDLAKAGGVAEEVAQWGSRVARTGELGASLRVQARAGQRAALSFAGQPIVPRHFSEAVLGATEDVSARFAGTDFGQALNKMFVSASRRAPEALRALYGAGKAQSGKAVIDQMLKPAARDIELMTRKAKVPLKVAQTLVAEAVQRGEFPSDMMKIIEDGLAINGHARLDSKVLLRGAMSINAANAYAIATEKKAGLAITHLMDPLQYLKRMITPEGLQATRKANSQFVGLGPREFSLEYGAQIMRDPRLKNMTISEINELGRAGELPFAKGIKVKEFFHEDPFVATAHRLSESAQAIGTREFLEGAMRLYGKGAGQAPGDWVPVTKVLSRGLNIPKDMVFPKAVAELLDSHYEKMISPQYLQGFLQNFDKVQGAWKSLTLPIWPSFHMRNLISDFWMISAVPGGIPAHRLLGRAVQAGKTLMGTGGSVRLQGRWWTYKELKTLAENSGVLHMGAGPGLEEAGRKALMERARDPLSLIQNNAAMRFGVTVGEGRENLTRLTYFIEQLGRGAHPLHAALETKLRLFDYGELSAFEKQVMRRVFPFYSWARNNIPFQIGHLVRRPGYGAGLQKLREEAGLAFGSDTPSQGAGPLPQFLSRGVPIPVGQTSEGLPRFVRSQNIVPLGDISQVTSPGALGQALVDQLSPFPKAIGESMANYDLFRNRPLERFPGESTSYLGAQVPNRATPFLDLVRPLAEASRLSGIGRTGPQQGVGEKAANFLIGRTYQVDPMEQMAREAAAVKGAVSRLQYLRKLALSRGDNSNAEAAEREIQAIMNDPARALNLRR